MGLQKVLTMSNRIHKQTIKEIIILNGTPFILLKKARRVKHYINALKDMNVLVYNSKKLATKDYIVLVTELDGINALDRITKGLIVNELVNEDEIKLAQKLLNSINNDELLNTVLTLSHSNMMHLGVSGVHTINRGYFTITYPLLKKYENTILKSNKYFNSYSIVTQVDFLKTLKYVSLFGASNQLKNKENKLVINDPHNLFHYKLFKNTPIRLHPNFPKSQGRALFIRTQNDLYNNIQKFGDKFLKFLSYWYSGIKLNTFSENYTNLKTYFRANNC